jgi:hypothetical protein
MNADTILARPTTTRLKTPLGRPSRGQLAFVVNLRSRFSALCQSAGIVILPRVYAVAGTIARSSKIRQTRVAQEIVGCGTKVVPGPTDPDDARLATEITFVARRLQV